MRAIVITHVKATLLLCMSIAAGGVLLWTIKENPKLAGDVAVGFIIVVTVGALYRLCLSAIKRHWPTREY